MEISTIKRSSRILKELNHRFNRDKHYTLRDNSLNYKVSGLAKNKLPNKSKHIIDILSKNNEAKAILNLFYNMLKLPKSHIFLRDKINYFPSKANNYKKNPSSPIGILGVSWLNALLQFMIAIKSIRNMFYFAPKSFFSFNLFLDTYEIDKKNQKDIVSIKSDILLECLLKKFSEKNFITNRGKLDLYKILSLIMSIFYEENQVDQNFLIHKNSNFLSFRPACQIRFDLEKNISFESYIFNILNKSNILSKELLISFKWFSNGKRFFLNYKSMPKTKILFFNVKKLINVIYELDAFIEFRQDSSSFGHYITYVKKENLWYQCDDSRINIINENNLYLALSKSILLHYKFKNQKSSFYI
ncbi:MAG: hypothetical protein K1060chlam5_00746 [Candidatus Anoxychlamydiales bacterium]|nr:hypothetical protein [Candidatus Anoxychlamydiales bacterium]